MSDIIIKDKPKRFFRIRNFFKLKKLEGLLKEKPVIFDKIDEENIEEVIRNFVYTDKGSELNGVNNPITAEDVVDIVISFYYSISKEMGDTIKNLYSTYKDKIFIEQLKDTTGTPINTGEIASVGVTYNPNQPVKKKMLDGTEKEVVCSIDLCQNYTTYYTVAHEFMHLIQRAVGNEDEKLTEVNTRFIEYILGEYLAEKGIITQENVDDHNLAINCEKPRALKLKDILTIQKLAKENKLTQSRLLNTIGCSPESLYYRLNGIIDSINGEEINQPKNDLRFINGIVGANRLLEIYSNNKASFKRVYGRMMSKKYQGKFNFDHFFNDIERAIYEDSDDTSPKLSQGIIRDAKSPDKTIDDEVWEK